MLLPHGDFLGFGGHVNASLDPLDGASFVWEYTVFPLYTGYTVPQLNIQDADYSTAVCTIHVENIWKIVRPIWNYVELKWVALPFHFGRL